jgi:hypothetical protein
VNTQRRAVKALLPTRRTSLVGIVRESNRILLVQVSSRTRSLEVLGEITNIPSFQQIQTWTGRPHERQRVGDYTRFTNRVTDRQAVTAHGNIS